MGTLQKVQAAISSKVAIKNAIESKGVVVGDIPFDEYAGKVGQIGYEAPENDVCFYDYDGKRIASFTIAEAKALTQAEYNAILPPAHSGLTFQEWNWSLSDITSYNRQYIDIGANYSPNDGNTHLKIIATSTDISLELTVYKGSLVVDYGDGTSDTFSNAGRYDKIFTHTYASTGKKEIILSFTPSENDGMTGLHNLGNPTVWYGFNIYELNLGHYTDTSVYCQLSFLLLDCLLSVPTYLFNVIKCNYGYVRQLTFPKGSSFAVSVANYYVNNYRLKICFPPTFGTINSSGMFGGMGCSRMVLPETTSSTPYDNNNLYGLYVASLSLPSSASWSSAMYFNSGVLEYIDIVQGWVPNVSLQLNYSSRWSAENMVKFITKLGTTQTAITLTFGSTNLNKLTAEEKAIATNKGYTLA